MPLSDILLHLESYPDPTPVEAVNWAVGFAGLTQARLSALAVKVRIPVHSNRMANYLIGLSGMVREEEAKSAARCQELLRLFETRAKEAGRFEVGLLDHADIYDVGERVAQHARTRDLCIVPLNARADTPGSIAETVVFASGRPVILLQSDAIPRRGAALSTVVIAWDGSRPAARAMADALPILRHAGRVRLVIVLNEKQSAVSGLGDEPVRHLKCHGIGAVVDELDAQGAPIGAVLERYVKALPADLLVMGAFDHSRVREFLLGGATQSILRAPPVPVLLSH